MFFTSRSHTLVLTLFVILMFNLLLLFFNKIQFFLFNINFKPITENLNYFVILSAFQLTNNFCCAFGHIEWIILQR